MAEQKRITAPQKQTTDRRQIWTLLGLSVATAIFFGYAVLPYADPGAALLGKPAPDFTLPVLTGGDPGNRWSLADQRGKVIVIDFWASWCGPCRAQAPIIERVSGHYPPSQVAVIGINTADAASAATEFVKTAQLTYPSLQDHKGTVANSYGATALPTLAIIDRSGIVSTLESRVFSEAELKQHIDDALLSNSR